MKKHINKIILILFVLNGLLIYFSFFGFKERSKEIEISKDDKLIKKIGVEYESLGNPFADVKITDISNMNLPINSVATSLGTSFDISGNFSNLQLQKAEVTLEYNKNKLPEGTTEDDLGILWYDQKNNRMIEMKSKVDKKNGKITFTTDHFSEYIFIDITKWHELWARQVAKIRETKAKFSVSFIIDDSGSMVDNDSTKKRIDATRQAINSLTENDRYNIIQFSSDSKVLQEFTNNIEDAEDDYEKFISSGGTDIVGAVEKGIDLLEKEDKDQDKIIILLTDGEDYNLSSKKDSLVRRAVDSGIVIFGIGLEATENSNLNFDVFSSLATETTGKFYRINDEGLTELFTEITNATVGIDGTIDTDGDGIPDGLESAGMRDQFGNILKTNPYLVDTDGDEKSDMEEIGTLKQDNEGNYYYERVSNPLVNDNGTAPKSIQYHLGPTEDADPNDVWDSGFRANENAFRFRNFAVNETSTGGICAGFATFTEKTYNGVFKRNRTKDTARMLLKTTKGYDLTDSRYNQIFNSKKLYYYYPASEKLQSLTSRTLTNLEILDSDMENGPDAQLIKSLVFCWMEYNTKTFDILLGDYMYPITDKTINSLKNIFGQQKKIVSVDIPSHTINAYALEKLSENVYLLYVYDNNYPYDPLSITRKNSYFYARNSVILLQKDDSKNILGLSKNRYIAKYFKQILLNDNSEINEYLTEIDILCDFDMLDSSAKYYQLTNLPIFLDYKRID